MDPLRLVDNLQLKEKEIIAVYGAGGKTSLLFRLAQELSRSKQKVVVTTTTKIFKPDKTPCVICPEAEEALVRLQRELLYHDVVVLGSSLLPNNKLTGIENSWIEKIFEAGIVSYILVEADGAAGKPIKGYASYEPVLPPDATLITPILGIDALGLVPESKYVHRPELLLKITGSAPGEPLTLEHLLRCLKYMIDLGRDMSPRARIIPVINKIDLYQEADMFKMIAEAFSGKPALNRILFTSLRNKEALEYIYDLSGNFSLPFVSCVLLAAGSSCRMRADKLSLKINEHTILGLSLKNVLESRVEEVILVTRPEISFSRQIHKLISDPRVKVVTNNNYLEGIASSLKTGITASHPLTQGIIFTLADQPFIPPEIYNSLLKKYAVNMNLLTFPLFKGRRGNPVLFDRRTWPRLMELEGDEGGRQIIPCIPEKEKCGVETISPGILVDIDTPEDLKKYEQGLV